MKRRSIVIRRSGYFLLFLCWKNIQLAFGYSITVRTVGSRQKKSLKIGGSSRSKCLRWVLVSTLKCPLLTDKVSQKLAPPPLLGWFFALLMRILGVGVFMTCFYSSTNVNGSFLFLTHYPLSTRDFRLSWLLLPNDIPKSYPKILNSKNSRNTRVDFLSVRCRQPQCRVERLGRVLVVVDYRMSLRYIF